jgi:hypothetical protein
VRFTIGKLLVPVGQEVVVVVAGHPRIKLEEIRDGGSGWIALIGIDDDSRRIEIHGSVSGFSFHIETRPVSGDTPGEVKGFRDSD